MNKKIIMQHIFVIYCFISILNAREPKNLSHREIKHVTVKPGQEFVISLPGNNWHIIGNEHIILLDTITSISSSHYPRLQTLVAMPIEKVLIFKATKPGSTTLKIKNTDNKEQSIKEFLLLIHGPVTDVKSPQPHYSLSLHQKFYIPFNDRVYPPIDIIIGDEDIELTKNIYDKNSNQTTLTFKTFTNSASHDNIIMLQNDESYQSIEVTMNKE